MIITSIVSVLVIGISLTVWLVSRKYLRKPGNPIEDITEEIIK